MDKSTPLVERVPEYIGNLFTYHLSKNHCFHNLEHTKNVVRAVGIISDHLELNENDKQVIQLAAWFHDTGFLSRPTDNERIGVLIAENYLKTNELDPAIISKVRGCVLATKKGARAKNQLEAIIQDADMFHLAQENYWAQSFLLRNELYLTSELHYDDEQWYGINLNFLKTLSFKTPYGQKFLEQARNTLIYENEIILKSIAGTEMETDYPSPSYFPSMGTKEVIVLDNGCKIAI